MQFMAWRMRLAMLPEKSRQLCTIGMMVISTGAQIVRCRSGKSLHGRAATPGLR
jgi:hypothetical protein